MKAQDFVNKLFNECGQDPMKFSRRLIESLVRLTKRYTEVQQEEIKTKIIKGDIFAYIFVPEVSRKHAITINEPIQCGLALQSQAPTIADLPEGTNVGYILVKNELTLYFINKFDPNDKIRSFSLNDNAFSTLTLNLKLKGDVQVIELLSFEQIKLIKEITGHSPIISRLSSTYPQEWLALTPSQSNMVIQNPKSQNIISLGERYGPVDIDCLWVVKEEADSFLSSEINREEGDCIRINQQSSVLPQKSIKPRKREVSQPSFLDYIKSYCMRYTCKAYINMMKQSGYVFDKKEDYLLHLRQPSPFRIDNTHPIVREVALVKNGLTKAGKDKYKIYFSVSVSVSVNGQKTTRELSSETLPRYFKKIYEKRR